MVLSQSDVKEEFIYRMQKLSQAFQVGNPLANCEPSNVLTDTLKLSFLTISF